VLETSTLNKRGGIVAYGVQPSRIRRIYTDNSVYIIRCAVWRVSKIGRGLFSPVVKTPGCYIAYASGAQFNAQWNACVTYQARAALEQEAISRSPIQDVQFAAMVKINLRLQATVGELAGQVQAATVAAQAAGNVDCFTPAAPPKYENKIRAGM
jgi:hypothetical protein